MKGLSIIIALSITIFLILFISLEYLFLNQNDNNISLENSQIHFNSLTLKQKIAQMIIIRGDSEDNLRLIKYNIGGIFLDKQKSSNDYKNLINNYKKNSKLKLFISTDLEGAWNPFHIFKDFPSFSEINSSDEGYRIGIEHGEFLRKLGFNLNFAPVSEFEDKSYGGRVFLGNKSQIKSKLESYIRGLQKNVYGVCKHYPGKGMMNNLHSETDKERIAKDDLELFKICFKNNISSIMIGHQIVDGEIDSNKKPASVSPEVILTLFNFSGLIISDEINMQGLRSFYNNKSEMYKDLINSGENIILDFDINKNNIDDLISEIEELVKKGEIDEKKIDISVKKILIAKGYKVI